MCVLALAWRAHPDWLLVAAGNRDEMHDRPAAALARWEAPAGLIAGRDLQSGGSWMGVSEAGRFAIVTNLRGHGGPEPNRASRGALVADMLAGVGRYADPDAAPLLDFNPFNLIVADRDNARFLSNRPNEIRTTMEHGIYGLSNGALDEPWPKTMALKAGLLDWIVAGADGPESLLDLLGMRTMPDAGLTPSDPSDAPLEPRLTPIFIRHPLYGTRCSTVVAIDALGHGTIIERRFDAAGEKTGETSLDFSWPI